MFRRLAVAPLALAALLAAACGASAHRTHAVASAARAGTDPTALPIGDGKVTTAGARRGSVYACVTMRGGGGAFQDGPWISADGTYDLTRKAIVDGQVSWRGSATLNIARSGRARVISGNAVPTRGTTGIFPIRSSDDAYRYDRNPNRIAAQSVRYTVPAAPTAAARPSCLRPGAIAVATNGVAIFNALDGENRDAVAHETQDSCQGHPERTSLYHYHSASPCLYSAAAARRPGGVIVGWALDGFPIVAERNADGSAITNANLDACHGRTSAITWSGRRVRAYHYVATLQYPYTLGCFRGTPAAPGA